jgi:sugar/nucleoside kinase (ribokinase family)
VNVVGVVGTDFDLQKIQFKRPCPISFDGLDVREGKTFRWGGRYYEDPNQRDTLFTQLHVFEDFKPLIPAHYRKSKIVFLANINPELQLQVLEQIEKPELVVLDTMNFWISGKRAALDKVIRHTQIIILNDQEIRQLTGTANLIAGGQKILEKGPRVVVIKKGEHGAIMMQKQSVFLAPAYPVNNVVDPTGAGDSFAGGFVGYLARQGVFDESEIRKAMIYGTVIASFNVEDFSFNRLVNLTEADLQRRYEDIKKMMQF